MKAAATLVTLQLATVKCGVRRIVPAPRSVYLSNEIHESLGRLLREPNLVQREKATEAWGTVFYIRHFFTEGSPVTPYLSRGRMSSTSKDQLLWDYGLHHFHLSRRLEQSGFVERSDYLLFARVTEVDAFFVDIRPHHDPEEASMGETRPFNYHTFELARTDQAIRTSRCEWKYSDRRAKEGIKEKEHQSRPGAGPACHCADWRRDDV